MKPKKVLFADDDSLLRRAMVHRLQQAGFEVVEAGNGQTTLQQARDESPDVLILDVHMPAGDGLRVLDQLDLSEDLAGLPVIYISGDHDPHLYQAAMKRGAGCVVHKPFRCEDLVQAIDLLSGSSPAML